MEVILTAFITFVATNIDDIFMLSLFFAETNATFRRRHIVVGQYLGFGALVLVSLLGFLGSLVIPSAWLGLLGLAPIGLGLHRLFSRNPANDPSKIDAPTESATPQLGGWLNAKTYSVAAVTFANGGDNIGIYTPLFASSDGPRLALTIGIFLLLVAVWCFIGYRLTRAPGLAQVLSKHGRIIVPVVLIGLGIYIMVESGTLAWLGL